MNIVPASGRWQRKVGEAMAGAWQGRDTIRAASARLLGGAALLTYELSSPVVYELESQHRRWKVNVYLEDQSITLQAARKHGVFGGSHGINAVQV